MAKRKTKMYETTESSNENHMKITADEINKSKHRNLMHFEHQLKTRMLVVESKKYKKPKYPHKDEEI